MRSHHDTNRSQDCVWGHALTKVFKWIRVILTRPSEKERKVGRTWERRRGRTAPCVPPCLPQSDGELQAHLTGLSRALDAVTFLWQASRHHCSSVHPWPAWESLLSVSAGWGQPDASADAAAENSHEEKSLRRCTRWEAEYQLHLIFSSLLSEKSSSWNSTSSQEQTAPPPRVAPPFNSAGSVRH